jgi:hypothetical protein
MGMLEGRIAIATTSAIGRDRRAVLPAHGANGRIGTRALGRLAVYLCSDDAVYVPGGRFTIDGRLASIPAACEARPGTGVARQPSD